MEHHIVEILQGENPCVLITLLHGSGAAPRQPGARMLLSDFEVSGTIGGGCMEALAVENARKTLVSGVGSLLHYVLPFPPPTAPVNFVPSAPEALAPPPDLRELLDSMEPITPVASGPPPAPVSAASPSPPVMTEIPVIPNLEDDACAGTVDILLEYINPGQCSLFEEALEHIKQGQIGCWTVDISRPQAPQRAFRSDPEAFYAQLSTAVAGQPGADSLTQKPGLYTVGSRSLYVEPLTRPACILLCGAGHVALAVAALAEQARFVVDVVDDRPEYANEERFPMARNIFVLPDFENLAEHCAIDQHHYVVIITRDHHLDREVLVQALPTKARYIGMIGNRKKRDALYANLREQGFPITELACVRCPIGLPIGAESPDELAIAIMAELIAARAGCLPRHRSN